MPWTTPWTLLAVSPVPHEPPAPLWVAWFNRAKYCDCNCYYGCLGWVHADAWLGCSQPFDECRLQRLQPVPALCGFSRLGLRGLTLTCRSRLHSCNAAQGWVGCGATQHSSETVFRCASPECITLALNPVISMYWLLMLLVCWTCDCVVWCRYGALPVLHMVLCCCTLQGLHAS